MVNLIWLFEIYASSLIFNIKRMKGKMSDVLKQRQIDAADKQIDNLVYDLYGLTEEEIKIVEG